MCQPHSCGHGTDFVAALLTLCLARPLHFGQTRSNRRVTRTAAPDRFAFSSDAETILDNSSSARSSSRAWLSAPGKVMRGRLAVCSIVVHEDHRFTR